MTKEKRAAERERFEQRDSSNPANLVAWLGRLMEQAIILVMS
jgi:hypothetical protein